MAVKKKAPPMPPMPKGMKPLMAQDRKLDALRKPTAAQTKRDVGLDARLGRFDNDADEKKRRKGR